uniref:Uncharacterized protein n=1 Tax=Arundo donax TaxID=35708 RepID=A0A0A8Y073_ARUDO
MRCSRSVRQVQSHG